MEKLLKNLFGLVRIKMEIKMGICVENLNLMILFIIWNFKFNITKIT